MCPGNICQGATRLFIAGNSLSPSDFAFSGWGTGATISSISRTDSRFQFTMMAGSSPCGRGCATVTLTFHDRPWNTIQTVTPKWIGGTGTATELATTNNLSSLTMTFKGTPGNGQTYTYSVIVSSQSAVSFSQLHVNPVVQNPVGPQTTGAKPLTVPGNLIANSLNGAAHLMDGVKYPFTRAGLQECINDAISSFGTCDASAVPSVTFRSATALQCLSSLRARTIYRG